MCVSFFILPMTYFPRHLMKFIMNCSHLARSTLPSSNKEEKLEPKMHSKSSVFLALALQVLQ